MKIDLLDDGELSIQAKTFQEARALAILYQRIAALRSASEDYIGWTDHVFLDDTGKTLALVWTSQKEEADQ